MRHLLAGGDNSESSFYFSCVYNLVFRWLYSIFFQFHSLWCTFFDLRCLNIHDALRLIKSS